VKLKIQNSTIFGYSFYDEVYSPLRQYNTIKYNAKQHEAKRKRERKNMHTNQLSQSVTAVL